MGKNVGIWLDHEKAYVIAVSNSDHSIEKIDSNIEARIRFIGESKSFSGRGGNLFNPSKKRTKRKKHQMNQYISDLTNRVSNAENILIFGPAYAKTELKKVLIRRKDKPSLHLETADKMSENQMVAKVKKHFNY